MKGRVHDAYMQTNIYKGRTLYVRKKICLLWELTAQLQYRVVIGVYYAGANARTALLCD
jgi:hypothetical protein